MNHLARITRDDLCDLLDIAEACQLRDELANAALLIKVTTALREHLFPEPATTAILETAAIQEPAWVPCTCCENYLCNIHGGHVHDCPCPSLEFWDLTLGLTPYEQGGRLTPEEVETLKTEHGYEEE